MEKAPIPKVKEKEEEQEKDGEKGKPSTIKKLGFLKAKKKDPKK